MILILFILLVLVVGVFDAKPNYCSSGDGGSSITGTKGFNIFNNSPYRLELISISNPLLNPPDLNIPRGGSHHFEVPCSSSLYLEYYAYSEDNYYWGSLKVEFFTSSLCLNYGIRNDSSTGKINYTKRSYIAVYVY
ncbi:hypothetical protein M3223_17165 [Paenibacillus pasadenensis]|uniref:hypothetical protein n=1 Tax=Paenibacillus pasadenensis TaxID=217090 RepID=UPI00203FB298|nr:hypothetical protein [Paenibacillus pasadenensis]MCM3749089.1 hypothetical protein [Paenibacillus pasadenensis]